MRRNVLGRRVRLADESSIRYSFSAGVCRFEIGDDLNATLARADRALYCAKSAGRNRTVSWGAPPA
jgi:PleD family two-component response regulator